MATTRLGGGSLQDVGGDLDMGEVEVGLTRRFRLSPRCGLSTGLRYSLRSIAASDAARLPGSLHVLSADFGAECRARENLELSLRVSPGLSSDFQAVTLSDVRVAVSLHAQFRVSKALSLLGGIAYTGQDRSAPVLPAIGVLYVPTEKWSLTFGFPRTGVLFRPNRRTELSLTGELSMGEYQLHQSAMGASALNYRDYRAVAGAEIRLWTSTTLGIAGGYAFARRFEFFGGSRSALEPDDAPFGRVALRFSW